jgi:hypothetical protein
VKVGDFYTVAHDLCPAESTVNTVMGDAAHITEHVNFIFHLIYVSPLVVKTWELLVAALIYGKVQM